MQQEQHTSSNDSNIACTGDQQNLLSLADAALTHAQEGQQPAQASAPPESPPTIINNFLPAQQLAMMTTPPVSLNSNEEPTDGSRSDADKDEQNTTTVINASSSVQAQPSQAASNRGSTDINRATRPVDPAGFPARTPNHRNLAPLQPDPGLQWIAVTPQARKRRTTRFDRATRGGLTEQCRVVTPLIGTPVVRHIETGKFHCPRCNGRYTMRKSVRTHFPKCVTKYGNPNGLSWWDHDTLKVSRDYFNRQVVKAEEEDQVEGEEEDQVKGEEDEDNTSRSKRTRTR